MSEENKKVELKENELEKTSGGYKTTEEIINESITKLNSVSNGGGNSDLAALINGALNDINNGALSDATRKLKTIIENYGPLTYIPLYASILSVIQEVYFTFIYDLNVSI